ncbi:MAG: GNAT family protein [Miltoncostaeaceae bacterium]
MADRSGPAERTGQWRRVPLALPDVSAGAVLLREPEGRDVVPVLEACRDPGVQRYTRIPYPYDVRDARAFVYESGPRRAGGLSLELVATDRPDGGLCGVVGIVVDRFDPGRAEIGYWTHPDHRGRGIARGALWALGRWCLGEGGFARIDLTASAANLASIAVARGCGFREEGRLRESWPTPEGREDMLIMSLIRADLGPDGLPAAPAA